MGEKKKPAKKPDGRGKRPRDPNQLAKGVIEQSVGDRSDSPCASSPIGKGNEQTAPGPDAPEAKTEQANPEEILATESGVSPETQQENRASTNEDTRLSENQQGEQDAPVPDGVALPIADKVEEATETTDQTQRTSNRQNPSKPTPRDYKRRHDRCVLIANGVMAGAAVVAVIVYGLQWAAMRSQLAQMKADSESGSADMKSQLAAMTKQGDLMSEQLEQMRLASRAWVGLTGASCTTEIASHRKLEVRLTFTNSGETPANKVRIACELYLGAKDCDIEAYASDRKEKAIADDAGERTIAPHVSISAPQHSNRELTDIEIAEIRAGTKVLYALGEAVYDDIFRQRHMTLYCWTVDPNGKSMKAYKQYNRME